MIWACSPKFFEHRRQLRRLKPRPAGRLASAWHSFVNFTCYCIVNDTSTDNVEQVPDEAAVIVSSNQPSVATTRSILMAEQASNSSGLQQSNSLRKRRSSSFLSSLLTKSSVAPLEVPSSSPSSLSPSSSLSPPPPSVSPLTSPSSSCKVFTKRVNMYGTISPIASWTTSTQDEIIEQVNSGSNSDMPNMRINMNRNDHIRSVPVGTISDVDKLIKRTLDWGMSSRYSVTPSSSVPMPSTDSAPDTKSGVRIEVLLGLKKPTDQYEAMAQQSEFGNETPYWMLDESRDKESDASRGAEQSRDGGVDSGLASRNVSTNN